MSGLPAYLAIRGQDLEVRVKAVPGAKRDEIAGPLGDRLKIRVSAPPEAGRANAAIAQRLAEVLGVAPRAIELATGAANPQKTFVLRGEAPRAPAHAARLAGG